MTSVETNKRAMAALQTLRSTTGSLNAVQAQVSSGLRVAKASDDAAYWAIATTMRSDRAAISAVHDALGLGAAKADVAYTGMSSVIDILGDFKSKLVAAAEEGVDKAKIQTELDQLKQQVVSIANSASFSGQNWLNTNVSDITDNDVNAATVVSSFVHSTDTVVVNSTEIHLSETSLFNSTGGGILQPDPRDLESIGGLRLGYTDELGLEQWTNYNTRYALQGQFYFDFSGPIVFDDPSDQISFNITVDADDPTHGLPGALNPGKSTSIVIDRATVDAVGASWNGVISNYQQYIQVLDYALGAAGSDASATLATDNYGKIIPNRIVIITDQNRSNGLDGSSVQVTGSANTTNSRGGLVDNSGWGARGSTMSLGFDAFQDYRDGNDANGVQVSFDFSINGAPSKSYSFDRTYVNNLLGKDSGKIETADEMVTLLQSLLTADWPDLIIESTSPGNVTLRSDPNVDRKAGAGTSIGFTNINVSIEPIPKLAFLAIDISKYPTAINTYINYIEAATHRAVEGASGLGALQSRIDMQTEFSERLMSSLATGVGRLVDAEMEEASSRLAAEQTQQQLAIQSLQIANSAPIAILSLFQ